MRSLDPLKAVTQRDADSLRQSLAQGWRPQTILAKTGPQPDFSVWTETVMLDWAEGLGLLDDFLPAITRRAEVMDAAVRNTSVGCVRALWDRLGLTVDPTLARKDENGKQSGLEKPDLAEQALAEPDREEDEGNSDQNPSDQNPSDLNPSDVQVETARELIDNGHLETDPGQMDPLKDDLLKGGPAQRMAKRSGGKTLGPGHTTRVTERMVHIWCRGLITAMGEPWTQDHEAKNVIPLIQFFQERGVNLDTYVYPGDYEPDDFRRSGHSLWTRAVLLKDWALVNILWPSDEETWKAWPRHDEVLLHLLDVVVGDYRGLQTDEIGLIGDHCGAVDWENEISSLNEEDKQGDKAIEVDWAAIQVETETFMRWISEYGIVWTTQKDLRKNLVQPTVKQISAWLRFPAMLKSERDRAVVWAIWGHVCSVDPHRTWLADLTLWPDDPDVRTLIQVAKGDNCAAFRTGWGAPMPDGTPTPEQRWTDMGGDSRLTEWMVP